MFKALKRKLDARREARFKKYADEVAHMDPAKLEELRDQQSPLRGMGRRR